MVEHQLKGLSDQSPVMDPLSYFSFQPVLYNWCNKDCGLCYPVCGMVYIKEPLLLFKKRIAHVVAAVGFLSDYPSFST